MKENWSYHPSTSLSLPCVCQGEIHAYHRYPCGLLCDTSLYTSLYHPLSFPLLYLSRGWEQQGTSDRLIRAELRLTMSCWYPLKLGEARWVYVDAYVDCLRLSVSACIHVQVHALVFNCLHASMSVYFFASVCVCVCVSVYECVFVPLLSAEPPWDEGEEEDDELEEVLCSMASRESSERRRSGLLEQEGEKNHSFLSSLKLYNIFILNRCMHCRTAMFFIYFRS